MNIEPDLIRSYRLRAHHLDKKMRPKSIAETAGACGLQNSPPGSWETAVFNRISGCSLRILQDALYKDKILLQAWSFRGAPVIFPTDQSDIFLTPLIAQDQEQPWIYTMGITGALDFLQMSFGDLLSRTREAVKYLDCNTVKSKEELDRILAGIIQKDLPPEMQKLWSAPSMYGSPDRQTVGGAAVSFLLRPCSFSSLVVFGERQGISPTFTSFKNWTGRLPSVIPDSGKELVRKYLHCYGPATVDSFMNWLGCSKAQALRLWNAVSEETETVLSCGKPCLMLQADMEDLLSGKQEEEKLILLGPHDPYLDIKDRTVILENKSLHPLVWKTVANPGVVLKGGRIIGIWKTKTLKNKLDLSIRLLEPLSVPEQKMLKDLAEQYASFRMLALRNFIIDG